MIKIEMDLPKSCRECKFCNINMIDGRWCVITQSSVHDNKIRCQDCPLIEIVEEINQNTLIQNSDSCLNCEHGKSMEGITPYCELKQSLNIEYHIVDKHPLCPLNPKDLCLTCQSKEDCEGIDDYSMTTKEQCISGDYCLYCEED